MSKNKGISAAIAASLLIPTKAISDEIDDNENIYGINSGVLDRQGARLQSNLVQLDLSIDEVLKTHPDKDKIEYLMVVWEQLMTNESARERFSDHPYAVLAELGVDSSFFDNRIKDLETMRIYFSKDVHAALEDGDSTYLLNKLVNLGVLKQDYPELVDSFKRSLLATKDDENFSLSQSDFDAMLSNEAFNDKADVHIQTAVAVATAVVVLFVETVTVGHSVAIVSQALLAHSEAMAWTNSTAWTDGGSGGGSDLGSADG